jgi:hypothetical protein
LIVFVFFFVPFKMDANHTVKVSRNNEKSNTFLHIYLWKQFLTNSLVHRRCAHNSESITTARGGGLNPSDQISRPLKETVLLSLRFFSPLLLLLILHVLSDLLLIYPYRTRAVPPTPEIFSQYCFSSLYEIRSYGIAFMT